MNKGLLGTCGKGHAEAHPPASLRVVANLHEQQQSEIWQRSRIASAAAYQAMSIALNQARTAAGKNTAAHHYMSEAKLVNFVLFGRFEKIDANSLSADELVLVEKVATRNAILIAQGRAYCDRKQQLVDYVARCQGKYDHIEEGGQGCPA